MFNAFYRFELITMLQASACYYYCLLSFLYSHSLLRSFFTFYFFTCRRTFLLLMFLPWVAYLLRTCCSTSCVRDLFFFQCWLTVLPAWLFYTLPVIGPYSMSVGVPETSGVQWLYFSFLQFIVKLHYIFLVVTVLFSWDFCPFRCLYLYASLVSCSLSFFYKVADVYSHSPYSLPFFLLLCVRMGNGCWFVLGSCFPSLCFLFTVFLQFIVPFHYTSFFALALSLQIAIYYLMHFLVTVLLQFYLCPLSFLFFPSSA